MAAPALLHCPRMRHRAVRPPKKKTAPALLHRQHMEDLCPHTGQRAFRPKTARASLRGLSVECKCILYNTVTNGANVYYIIRLQSCILLLI